MNSLLQSNPLRLAMLRSVLILLLLAAAGCRPDSPDAEAIPQTAPSPYAGQETRSIKALSDDDLAALRRGDGMGLALAAELNHYPGPRHVLELADALALTPEQRAETEAVMAAMRTEAVRLGEAVIGREEALEALFASGDATPEAVRAVLAELGTLRADLRFAHLNAHLAMRRLLTPGQVAHYDRLRGYGGGHPAGHDHAAGHAHPDPS
ncbi:MAG: Spy/CpxP family protein refolding chaperone [Rhodothermales bacterium]|nr:Spy/CpxP family protein refolding chaperone [Rhodothermales bacterium]